MRLVASLLAVTTTAVVLCGCALAPRDGTVTPAPTETLEIPLEPGPAVTSDCNGSPVVLDNTSPTFVLTGDCPSVTIQGQDIEATLPDVGVLAIAGDRVHVETGAIGTLALAGNDNLVGVSELGSVQLNGDRNAVDASGAIGAVSIGGNDNTVSGASIGAVSDAGARNVVRAGD